MQIQFYVAIVALIIGYVWFVYQKYANRCVAFFCSTFHARFIPIQHSFRYDIGYIGIDIDEINLNSFLISVRHSDYVYKTKDSLRKKLSDYFDRIQLPIYSTDRIFLVTTPRLFGYAFNPVSYYFIYRDAILINVLLEVNNTFGERHMYLLDDRNQIQTRIGFDGSFEIQRQFHVSPFNDRSGSYQCHIRDPKLTGNESHSLDVSLVVMSEEKKRFTGKVFGSGYRMATFGIFFRFLWRLFISTYLTEPRILLHAFILHYWHKLKVYPRPEPKLTSEIDDYGSQSLVRQSLTGFESFCIQELGLYFKSVRIAFPTVHIDQFQLKIRNYSIFTYPFLCETPCIGLFCSYAEGNWECEQMDQFVPWFMEHVTGSKAIDGCLQQRPKMAQIVKARLLDRFEKWMFKRITIFALSDKKTWMPYDVQDKVKEYLVTKEKGENSSNDCYETKRCDFLFGCLEIK